MEYTGTLLSKPWLDSHGKEQSEFGLYSPIDVSEDYYFVPVELSTELEFVVRLVTSDELQELTEYEHYNTGGSYPWIP